MKYIAFEGIDLCGKSTQASLLSSYLSSRNIPIFLTKEPGGTKLGSIIREIILQKQSEISISRLSEFFLFMADRAQQYEIILDRFKNTNTCVISDRCFMSTYAYQICGRQLDKHIFNSVENIFMSVYGSAIILDLIIYIDIDVDTVRQRMKIRPTQQTRFEEESDRFLSDVIQGYEQAYQRWSPRMSIIKINGNNSITDIHQQILDIVNHYFKVKK